jgi:hypothetical protein
LWKAEVGHGFSSVAVARGRLFTMGNIEEEGVTQDVVWCLDAATGAVIWKYAYAQPLDKGGYDGGPCVTPCVDGDRVFTMNKRGRVWCLDFATGAPIWDSNPQENAHPGDTGGMTGGMTSSPFVYGDLLITGTQALKKADGKVAWQVKRDIACQYASPVPYTHAGHKSALYFNKRGLTSVKIVDGSREWNYPLPSDTTSAGADPMLYGSQLLLTSRPFRSGETSTVLLQLTDADPKPVWTRTDIISHFQNRVIWQGHFFGCDSPEYTKGDGTLKCVDLKTGETRWSEPSYDWGQLTASDGKLLVLHRTDLSIVEASAQGYRLLARATVLRGTGQDNPAAAVAPVLANGRIYCRGSTGDLVCIDVTPKR